MESSSVCSGWLDGHCMTVEIGFILLKYFGILSVTLRRTSSDNLFYVRMHPQDCLAMNARLGRYSTLTELWIVYLHV